MNMNLKDGLDTMTDSIDKKPKCMYHTQVTATNELGEVLFEKSNVILVGGRRFTLEKLFNVTSTTRLTLNQILGINADYNTNATATDGPIKQTAVCLFGVGTGGSGATLGSVANPSAKESNLYNIVPMRYVEDEKELMVPGSKYYMHKEIDGMHAFYLKRFEQQPVIKLMVNGMPAVLNNADNSQPTYGNSAETYDLTADIETYIELQLTIGKEDVREYFQHITDNGADSSEHARINELALYLGYHDGDEAWSDYKEVEAFSKLTFNNESLADDTKVINIIYRIYI